jgi:hypothetical protein
LSGDRGIMTAMTVPKAYLREMKTKKERRQRLQQWEVAGRTDMVRLEQIEEKYSDPDDPMALALAQMQEGMRQYAIKIGVCDDCLAKFPDPLA